MTALECLREVMETLELHAKQGCPLRAFVIVAILGDKTFRMHHIDPTTTLDELARLYLTLAVQMRDLEMLWDAYETVAKSEEE